MGLSLKITGIKELEKQLREMASERQAKKIQRSAGTAAIRPMRRAVKQECPVDSGGLRKSIDYKVSTRGMHLSAIVGSDTAVMDDGKKGAKSSGTERAARHLHLVLFGHVSPEGKYIPGNDFMSRGYQDAVGASQEKYETKLREGIEKAADGGK